MKKLFELFSDKFFYLGTLFLIVFIPIYPKLPIFDIFGTWVYVRLEDFLVAFIILVFLITRLYLRTFSASRLTFPIFTYWFVGAISLISSVVIIGPKLVNFFPHLAVLHFLRRIEYMMLFFIAYEAIVTDRNRLRTIPWILAGTVVILIVYGFGQKFAGFPAFLTMNEEFAKGVPLRLPPTARVVSTFGGHYDLAAYLVMVIPILGSFVFGFTHAWKRFLFLLVTIGAVILLLFTASRISFAVYLIAISAMLVFHRKKILILPVIIISFIMLNFVGSASERFYKTFRYSDVVVDLSTGKPIGTLEKLEGGSAIIEEIAEPDVENLPMGSSFISVPSMTGQGKQQDIGLVISKDLASRPGDIATLSGSFLIQKALVYDISITTRFQGQWPKAIAAFQRNILLGSGYSTLSLAVDGNYHRLLGETGVVGFIAFLGIVAYAIYIFKKGKGALRQDQYAFVVGFFAGIVGLLLNAILIDVFEASKVAFTLWLFMGISLALLSGTKRLRNYVPYLGMLLTGNIARIVYIVIGTFYVYREVLTMYYVGDDFVWLRWAAQSSFHDILNNFTQSSGFFYRPVPKLVYFIMYSVFWLKQGAYHALTLVLYSGICLWIYSIMRALKIHTIIAFLAALLFGSLSIHHENVFWISGYSGLLGANFLLVAIRTAMWRLTVTSKLIRTGTIIGIYLLLLLSMMSYDSLIVAPLIFFLMHSFVLNKKEKWMYYTVFLVPLYWALRANAGAVEPSGDYGYRPDTFIINSIANTVGYIVATFSGPILIEQMHTLRDVLRNQVFAVSVFSIFCVMALLYVAWQVKNLLKLYTTSLMWFLCMLVACIPFAPLGGMAERYALIPSIFLILATASAVSTWTIHSLPWSKLSLISIVYIIILWWNTGEISRISKHWQLSHDVTQQTLIRIRSEFFPLRGDKTFIFLQTPIRYGRAWIFPVGIEDALWQIFRDGPYRVVQVSSVQEAFNYPIRFGERIVLRFEDYVVKRLISAVPTSE